MCSVGKKTLSIILMLMMVMSAIICMFGGLTASAAEEPISDINSGWTWPLAQNFRNITSGFGYRASMGDYHQGIDISSSGIGGQPVYAARKGTVVFVGWFGSAGNAVSIRHGTYNGVTIYTSYFHLRDPGCVSVGQSVDPTTVIGYVGNTGGDYGVHLHFQICKNDKNPAHNNNSDLSNNYYNPANMTYSYDHSQSALGNNPQGVIDIVEGKTGQVFVRGWAFDKDSPSSSIQVHVYIGGPAGTGEGHAIVADGVRDDVNSAYSITGKHGYSHYLNTSKTGSQDVYIYAINMYGGGQNVLLGSRTVNITADTEKPAFSDISITNKSKTGYTISMKFTDNVAASHVNFYTWTDANGRDDEKCTQGTISGSTVTMPILFSDHNNEKGNYTSHVYGYDLAGNYCFTVVAVGVESNAPTLSDVTVTNLTPSGYTVSCKVTDDTAVDYVQFPTWSAQTGANSTDQDDIIWGTGTKSGNTYSYTVKISEHNNERGRYKTHIYAYDVWGNHYAYPIENIYVPSSSEYYTVTYDANGGKGAPSSNSAYVEIKLSNTKPTRDGYEFLGWAKSSTATTAQYQPGETISPGKSLTLYAVWKLIPVTTYTLKYDANGGSNPPANQTGNGSITLSSTKPTRSGYTFKKWNTKSDGTGTSYNPGATYNLTANATLYAIWQQNPVTPTTYTLSYNANGGNNPPANQTGNGNIILSSTKPTRNGYTFKKWNTKSDGTGTSYNPGATYNLTANATLYAIWQKNETPDNPPVAQPTIQIKNYVSTKSVSWRATLKLDAVVENAPDGAEVHWFYNGEDKLSGVPCYISNCRNTFTIQAKLISKDGEVLAESDVETVTATGGFFAKLIAFFKGLFGLLPIIEQ